MHTVTIGPHTVGPRHPIAFIAEFGINANGSPELLKRMTNEAHALEIPFVKIQTRINAQGELTDTFNINELAAPRAGVPEDVLKAAHERGAIPTNNWNRIVGSGFRDVKTWDQKRALEFTKQETAEFIRHAKSLGMVGFSSPWCLGAIDILEELGVECYKVASPRNTHADMLRRMAQTGKPVILSTGGMDMPMVDRAVETLLKHTSDDKLVIMHCTSVYTQASAAPGDHGRSMLNLRCIPEFIKRFSPIAIGYSANDPGIEPMKAAAALGAVILEKHVTLSRVMYGSDQASSVEFRELEAPLRVLRELPDVLGDGIKKYYDVEKPVMQKLSRREDGLLAETG